MKVNKTISEILSSKWLIEPSAAHSYLPILANVLTGNTEFAEEYEEPEYKVAVLGAAKSAAFIYGPNSAARFLEESEALNQTVVVSIEGPIMKNDTFCGPAGSMTMASVVNQLSASDKVGTIIFDIDSPGGSVAGTQTYADAIANSSKRTIASISEGMAASAAYWLAAACEEIYVSRATDQVGSIGVYLTIADFKEAYEKKGIKVLEIYSRLSEEKNKDYTDAIEGDDSAIKDHLDFIAEQFHNHVKANRTINFEAGNPLKGAMYMAAEALELGLIDGIRSLEEIVGSISSSTSNNNTNPQMKISEQIAILRDVASTEEQITAATQALTAAFAADEVFTADEVSAAVTDAQASLSTPEQVSEAVATATKPLNETIESLKADKAALIEAAKEPTTPPGGGSEGQFGGPKDFTPTITP